MVTSGVVRRGAQVRVVRDGTVIHETTIAQLKRFKDDVREVAEGFECGILLEGFNDVREGDVFEVYETREVERTDLDATAPAPAPAQPTSLPGNASRRARGHGRTSAILSVELHFPEGGLAEGQAQVRQVGEGAAAEPLRRLGRRGRPPRALAAAALTLSCVAREHGEAGRLLDEAERCLNGAGVRGRRDRARRRHARRRLISAARSTQRPDARSDASTVFGPSG